MNLAALTEKQCEQARQWRNEDISIYRTSFYLTEEMQKDFYKNVVCNRNSDHRYYAVNDGDFCFIGMLGLCSISLENRSAEISIVINPKYRKMGYGEKALKLLIDEGCNRVNLDNIYGECYTCNPALKFWEKMILRLGCFKTVLPKRKFYDGKYYDSIYFNFEKDVIK